MFFKFINKCHKEILRCAPSSSHVCDFYFRYVCLNDLSFCVIKNNGNNIRCTTEGEKSNKCCARNNAILFVSLRGTAQEYLFAVFSLFILKENSISKGEILDNEFFYKIISQSKFLLAKLTRHCIKH